MKREYWKLVECFWQGKAEYSEIKLSQLHFVHHKSSMERPGIELELGGQTSAKKRLSHYTAYDLLKHDCKTHIYIYREIHNVR
jgi:hypothetical protein